MLQLIYWWKMPLPGALAYTDLKVKNNLGQFAQLWTLFVYHDPRWRDWVSQRFTYTNISAMVIMADNEAG